MSDLRQPSGEEVNAQEPSPAPGESSWEEKVLLLVRGISTEKKTLLLNLIASEIEAARRREGAERYDSVFMWLLGETDFRGREVGEGAYWWRTELRERIKAARHLPASPEGGSN